MVEFFFDTTSTLKKYVAHVNYTDSGLSHKQFEFAARQGLAVGEG